MPKKLGFQQLVEETLTGKRRPRAMPIFGLFLGMVLTCYEVFFEPESSSLSEARTDADWHGRHPAGGATAVAQHFLASLHLDIARQLLTVQWQMRERVWAEANVQLRSATVDTNPTVHTLSGNQTSASKGYNPKNRGKKSYQPIMSFIGRDTGVCDRPDGTEIVDHLESVAKDLPPTVNIVYARGDSGFYCWQAVEAHEKKDWQYIMGRAGPRVLWTSCRRRSGNTRS